MKTDEEYAKDIYSTIKDYRADDGIIMSEQHILDWGHQFGNNCNFILMEVAHILPKVYCSKEKSIKWLGTIISYLMKKYQYKELDDFLRNACFLKLQEPDKSQIVYVDMLDGIVYNKLQKNLKDYTNLPKKHYIYIDDVLCTGSTIGNDICNWLKDGDNKNNLKKGNVTLDVILMCVHSLGLSLQEYKFKKTFDEDVSKKIKFSCCYRVDNNMKDYPNENVNVSIPIKTIISQNATLYYSNLNATKNAHQAFRDKDIPKVEKFFTSPNDRMTYENILLDKGLEIISKISLCKPNIRPLGLLRPSDKMLGLGVHFFTWRNIPNNCPLVFWWSVPGHNWIPLFEPLRH